MGRLGAAPLGAVGLSNLVFFFCQAFFGFLLIVTTPRVANAVAGGDSAEVGQGSRPNLGSDVWLAVEIWHVLRIVRRLCDSCLGSHKTPLRGPGKEEWKTAALDILL